MPKLTVVRFLLIFAIGILLLWLLLYIAGSMEPAHLKKRLKKQEHKSKYLIIVTIYLSFLLVGLLLVFAMIKIKTKVYV